MRDADGQTARDSVSVRIYRRAPAMPPQMAATPGEVGFSARVGSGTTYSESILLRGYGADTLTWTASASASWLRLGKAAGATPDELEVAADVSGLPAGTATGVITITPTLSNTAPVTVSVTLEVRLETNRIFIPLVQRSGGG